MDEFSEDFWADVESYCKKTEDVRFRRLIKKLKQKGEWPFPFELIICCEMPHSGSFFINTLRQCGIDGTKASSLTKGMIEGRREAYTLMTFLRKYVQGFAKARMTYTAPVIGIRETRRIVGRYVLSEDDLIHGRTFSDAIALSGYKWDLPDPKKPSYQPMEGQLMARAYTEIPYRCLLPQRIENLLVAGRCISVSRNTLGPTRIMPACFAMGQAAGTAAAMAVASSIKPSDLNISDLQKDLIFQGAIIKGPDTGKRLFHQDGGNSIVS